MLKLEPFPSALLDKRGEGKGLGDKDVREGLTPAVFVCGVFFISVQNLCERQ